MKLVNENIKHFERGLDPRKAMGIGAIVGLKEALRELSLYVSKYVDVVSLRANRWEVLIDAMLYENKVQSIKNLNNKMIALGLDQFLKIPAHDMNFHVHTAKISLLYKFKPGFVGLFNQEDTLIEAMQFQRGLEPKAAMNVGVGAQLQKYAEEHYDISDFKREYVEVLDHLVNMGGDPNTMSDEQKKIFINWLLPRVDIKYLDENIIEGLYGMEWNLVPYFKKLPDDNFKFVKNVKNPKEYILITSDWQNFTDYFQKNSSRNSDYHKYIDAILKGDAYEYFQYDLRDQYEDNLDIYALNNTNPHGFGDIIEALQKLNFKNKETLINSFFRANTSEKMFDFIWQQADINTPGFLKLKKQIARAASETVEAGNEHAAFKDLTKQICEHFAITYLGADVDLKFKISESSLNLFIYAYYLQDAKIKFIEKDTYGDFDLEVFHDCFDNAIND